MILCSGKLTIYSRPSEQNHFHTFYRCDKCQKVYRDNGPHEAISNLDDVYTIKDKDEDH